MFNSYGPSTSRGFWLLVPQHPCPLGPCVSPSLRPPWSHLSSMRTHTFTWQCWSMTLSLPWRRVTPQSFHSITRTMIPRDLIVTLGRERFQDMIIVDPFNKLDSSAISLIHRWSQYSFTKTMRILACIQSDEEMPINTKMVGCHLHPFLCSLMIKSILWWLLCYRVNHQANNQK